MKQVVINIHRNLHDEGLTYGVDWQQHAFVHDEVQLSSRPGVSEKVKELSLKSFIESGNDFNFRVPIEGDAKLGSCWHETH